MRSSAKSYLNAAFERLEDALLLHNEGHYVLSMYSFGLAVECILRAFLLLRNSQFEARHNLWELWKKTPLSDVHRESSYERIHKLLSIIVVRWKNSYRFASMEEVQSLLWRSGQQRGVKGDVVKFNCKVLYEAAREFVQLGGLRWSKLNIK